MMPLSKRWGLAAAAVVWAAAGAARADNIHWSIGVHSPGVSVGIGSAPQVLVYPRPVYVAPPVYYQPMPVVVYPQPVHPGWGPHHRGKKWHHHRHGRDRDRDWDDRRHWR